MQYSVIAARLEHYSNLLDSSMNEGSEGDDVFLSFLRTFKNFPEVSTQKEIEYVYVYSRKYDFNIMVIQS